MKRLLSFLTVIIFGHILFTGVMFGQIITLGYSGWSPDTVGTWNPDTKTGTLTQDVNEPIEIISDSIILDGNGKTVTVSNTDIIGVFLRNRTCVTVKNLNVTNLLIGIVLYNSNRNILSNNTAYLNNLTGISLYNSSMNNLSDNTVNSNNNYGISLEINCNNNTIKDNTCTNNLIGIHLWSSSNNNLIDNITSNNSYGFRLYTLSDNNIITGNTISNNYRGIEIRNKNNNNEIYNNNFINNEAFHAKVYSGCTGNIFNLPNPTGGNYWSGWTSPDVDGDGFVDIPYSFTGGVDDFPWVMENGWLLNQSPVADAGTDQTVFVGEEVTFNGSGSYDPDGTIENYEWYFEDGFTESGITVTHTFIAEGIYTVILTVTDDDGAQAIDDVTITVQTPYQAIENLIADIENLSLNKGNINALTSKLYEAISSLEKENNNATINKLNAFINQVNAFIPQKISAEDGQALIEAANRIINQISGSLAKRGIIDKAAAQSKEYALEQNYPNPFNPETEIHYQLPKASHVVLKVYNLMGQEIKTLVNNYHTAGYHSVKWDGTNNHGMKVASGIYIYIMRAGSFIDVKKLIFIQ